MGATVARPRHPNVTGARLTASLAVEAAAAGGPYLSCMRKTSNRIERIHPGRFIILPGRSSAVEAALRACRKDNGGKVVGNPTVQNDFLGTVASYKGDGKIYTLIWIEDSADPKAWWREYARVHGHEVAIGLP